MRGLFFGFSAMLLPLAANAQAVGAGAVKAINEDKAKACRFIDTLFSYAKGSDNKDGIDKARERSVQTVIDAGGNAVVYKDLAIHWPNFVLMFDVYRCE